MIQLPSTPDSEADVAAGNTARQLFEKNFKVFAEMYKNKTRKEILELFDKCIDCIKEGSKEDVLRFIHGLLQLGSNRSHDGVDLIHSIPTTDIQAKICGKLAEQGILKPDVVLCTDGEMISSKEVEEIERLLQESEEYFEKGDYQTVITCLNKVFNGRSLTEPLNNKAIALLMRVRESERK